VQAVSVKAEEVVPLIDAVGPEGLYIITEWMERAAFEKVVRDVGRY
jgi:hypothetical protein